MRRVEMRILMEVLGPPLTSEAVYISVLTPREASIFQHTLAAVRVPPLA